MVSRVLSVSLIIVSTVIIFLVNVGTTFGETVPRLLTLDEAIHTALVKNRTLAGARSEVTSATWGVRKAYTNWLPKVEVTSGLTRLNDETLRLANAPIDFIKEAPGLPPEIKNNIRPFAYKNTYSTGLTVVQPIYNGGLEMVGIDAAEAFREKGRYGLQDTEQEVISRVKTAYYAVLQAQEMVNLSRETEKRTQSYLESTKRKAEAGIQTSSDILRWEVQLAADQGKIVEAGNGLAMARVALNEVMGVELEEGYTLQPPREVAVMGSAKGSVALEAIAPQATYDPKLLTTHPGVMVMKGVAKLQQANLKKVWSGFKPQINLAFSYSWERNNTLALDATKTWSTALMVNLPVFNSFGDYAAVEQARADLRKAEILVEDVERQFRLRAKSASLAIDAARERIIIAQKAVEQAEANLQTVRRRYETGVASNIDLVDAQTATYQARTMLINATYDMAIARVEFERATGRTR